MKHIPAIKITVMPETRGPHQPGSFKWIATEGEGLSDQSILGMQYLCPCGCGTVGEIRFPRPGEAPRSPTYIWDGNPDYPTVEPAFAHVVAGQIHWSGILQRGDWIGITFDDK
jgi:hypothetical protein